VTVRVQFSTRHNGKVHLDQGLGELNW